MAGGVGGREAGCSSEMEIRGMECSDDVDSEAEEMMEKRREGRGSSWSPPLSR